MKSNWKAELEEANGYARTVINSHEKGKFDNNFKFNLLTLAIEKFLVGYLDFIKYPAVTHGLATLIGDVSRKRDISDELKNAVIKIDHFQNICSGGELKMPDNDELSEMIQTLKDVKAYVENDMGDQVQA